MKFRGSSQVRFVNASGGATRVFRAFGRSLRCSTSLYRSTASATHKPKSSVQLGAKLKISGLSLRVGLSLGGVVPAATSFRSSPCNGSPTSRTLASMQSRFFSAHAIKRIHSYSVQCHCGPQQDPAPNPSIKRTCLRQAAYLQR